MSESKELSFGESLKPFFPESFSEFDIELFVKATFPTGDYLKDAKSLSNDESVMIDSIYEVYRTSIYDNIMYDIGLHHRLIDPLNKNREDEILSIYKVDNFECGGIITELVDLYNKYTSWNSVPSTETEQNVKESIIKYITELYIAYYNEIPKKYDKIPGDVVHAIVDFQDTYLKVINNIRNNTDHLYTQVKNAIENWIGRINKKIEEGGGKSDRDYIETECKSINDYFIYLVISDIINEKLKPLKINANNEHNNKLIDYYIHYSNNLNKNAKKFLSEYMVILDKMNNKYISFDEFINIESIHHDSKNFYANLKKTYLSLEKITLFGKNIYDPLKKYNEGYNSTNNIFRVPTPSKNLFDNVSKIAKTFFDKKRKVLREGIILKPTYSDSMFDKFMEMIGIPPEVKIQNTVRYNNNIRIDSTGIYVNSRDQPEKIMEGLKIICRDDNDNDCILFFSECLLNDNIDGLNQCLSGTKEFGMNLLTYMKDNKLIKKLSSEHHPFIRYMLDAFNVELENKYENKKLIYKAKPIGRWSNRNRFKSILEKYEVLNLFITQLIDIVNLNPEIITETISNPIPISKNTTQQKINKFAEVQKLRDELNGVLKQVKHYNTPGLEYLSTFVDNQGNTLLARHPLALTIQAGGNIFNDDLGATRLSGYYNGIKDELRKININIDSEADKIIVAGLEQLDQTERGLIEILISMRSIKELYDFYNNLVDEYNRYSEAKISTPIDTGNLDLTNLTKISNPKFKVLMDNIKTNMETLHKCYTDKTHTRQECLKDTVGLIVEEINKFIKKNEFISK